MCVALDDLRLTRRRFLGGLALAVLPLRQSRSEAPPVDGIDALKSSIYGPRGICFDAQNNLYIVDSLHRRVRRVDAKTEIITTIAGDGRDVFAGDNGPATKASLPGPDHVQVDKNGYVYISDYLKDRIRRIDPTTGIINTIAGTNAGPWESKGKDGDLASQRSLHRPETIALDSNGMLYGLDATRLFRIDKNGAMTTIAGKENARGFTGDRGPASAALLKWPQGLAIDSRGNIFVSDTDNYRLRRIDGKTGRITTIFSVPQPYTRQNGTSLEVYGGTHLGDLAVDGDEWLYFDAGRVVGVIDLKTGAAATYAGMGTRPMNDGILASEASFGEVGGIALDGYANLHVADWLGNKVWKIDRQTKRMTAVAGNGLPKHPDWPRL